jgi:hypothetical protein
MLVVRSSGRLGNQLFQVAWATRLRRPGQLILFLGFNESANLMGGLARWSIRIPIPDRFMKHVKKTTKLLVGLGLKLFVSEIGLSPWQQRHASLVEVFQLQDCHRPEAIEGTDFVGRLGTQMAEASEIDAERQCFVHLRFTDYANFFVRGRPVELPTEWYLAQMEELRTCYPGLHFRVYSDDLVRARLEIPLSTDTFFQELDSNETLVEMAQCQMGVLSASTFSWWAATVSYQFGHNDGPFIAPDFWESWGAGEWSDPAKRTEWLTYRSVCAPDIAGAGG